MDVLSRIVSEDKTVLAQNYALGVSAAGFLLYPLFNRFCKERLKTICFLFIGLLSVLGIAFIRVGTAYTAIFTTGLVLFLLLGLLGSGVFYVSMRMMKTDRYLARTVGICTCCCCCLYWRPSTCTPIIGGGKPFVNLVTLY